MAQFAITIIIIIYNADSTHQGSPLVNVRGKWKLPQQFVNMIMRIFDLYWYSERHYDGQVRIIQGLTRPQCVMNVISNPYPDSDYI